MAVREIVRGVLLITLFIAPAASGGARGGGPCWGAGPPAALPADFAARVDRLFVEWNRPDAPGCAVGIVHRGRVIYRKGFGSADLEYRAPNTPQTVLDVSVVAQSL